MRLLNLQLFSGYFQISNTTFLVSQVSQQRKTKSFIYFDYTTTDRTAQLKLNLYKI